MPLQICSRFSREYEEQTGIPVGFRLSFGGSGTQVIQPAVVTPPIVKTCSEIGLIEAELPLSSSKQCPRDKQVTPVPPQHQGSAPATILQARAVIDGLPADIAALALPLDIMKIADAGLMRKVRSFAMLCTLVGQPAEVQAWAYARPFAAQDAARPFGCLAVAGVSAVAQLPVAPSDMPATLDSGRPQDWRQAAPNNAVLATSVVAVVVRQGNPKGIKDWDDLTRSFLSSRDIAQLA